MRYLLDTNIVSDFMRHPRGVVASKIERVGEEAVFTSIVVAAELRFGIRRSGSRRLVERLREALEALTVAPLEAPADTIYGDVRSDLERRGLPIGANDLLIAAQCLALDATMVTDNVREFSRIPDLTVENWLRS